MKQDKDWIDVMRSTLRDAEVPPPADGWARLERELGVVPTPRVPAWRIYWPRIAAAAAAIVICITAGEYLWYKGQGFDEGNDGNVISEVVSGGPAAVKILSEITGADAAPELAVATPVQTVEDVAANRPAGTATRIAASRRMKTSEAASASVSTENSEVASASAASGNPGPSEVSNSSTTTTTTTAASSASEPSTRSSARARQATPQTLQRTLPDGEFVAYTRPHKQASFSLHGGGGVTGGNGTGTPSPMQSSSPGGWSGGNITLMKQYDYARGSFRHHQPLSFGLSVRKEFAHGLSLESGVNYTLLHSDVSLFTGSEQLDQKLHFIGVPLRMNWQFLERGRFSLYIGAGGMVEKCVSARFDGESVDEPKVQWSVLGAAGAQYRLGGTVALYFEPEVSYYFTETQLRTVRTDSPLTLTLRMGVRLSF